MKILVDMNLSHRWAGALSQKGIDAMHWRTVGPADAPDTAIMDYAEANGFTVFTRDLDFGILLAVSSAARPSVIQLRAADARPEALLEPVAGAISRLSAEIEQGALVTIDANKTRVHVLPFT
jgi:predicted nuclease of predicted toxin-antitoxin system